MERSKLTATTRHERGSRACGRLRRQGRIPAVVYGKEQEPTALSINARELREILAHHHGSHAVIDLAIQQNGDSRTDTVLIQEVQRDPVTHYALAVDFLHVSTTEKMATSVSIILSGDAKGVKEGGVLEHHLHEVEIECLPDDLPGELVVEMAPFEIGNSIHVRDIACPSGVTILADSEDVIAHINAPRLQLEEVSADAEPTSAQPEIVKQKGAKEEA
ncbi:MAG: 50S ribosomal protein L25 [Armatimonadetes bacterium]|nr:50S ribosomal protein L25 [Armatimonadota bacterium]